MCWGPHRSPQLSGQVHATVDWGVIHGVSETYFLPSPDFMLMLRYCCNQKILHLERAIGPHIRLYSQQFDYLIDTTYAQYFDINFAANVDLAAIRSNEHALSHDHLIQLARVQLRALPIDGGLDILSMLDVDLPAFYVAHVRHLHKLIHEGHSGSLLIQNGCTPSPP